jgi:anti-sigma regulatory factor (Ser/Thr protein kinase)
MPSVSRSAKQPAQERVLRFEMVSARSAIGPAIEQILSAVKDVRLSKDRLSDLAVALAEALSNAAIHGNKLDAAQNVQIRVTVQPGLRAVIDVKDAGQGFDHSRVSDPTDPERLLTPGGRGVFLMRQLVDRLAYENGGSRVLLTVERRPRVSAALAAESPG